MSGVGEEERMYEVGLQKNQGRWKKERRSGRGQPKQPRSMLWNMHSRCRTGNVEANRATVIVHSKDKGSGAALSYLRYDPV